MSLKYSREREQFGRPIATFQANAFKLADMAVSIELARNQYIKAAWLKDQGRKHTYEATVAKLYASEAAYRTCERAARVLASYGFANDYPIERYLRDVRFTLIGGGTSEILRINIARGCGAGR